MVKSLGIARSLVEWRQYISVEPLIDVFGGAGRGGVRKSLRLRLKRLPICRTFLTLLCLLLVGGSTRQQDFAPDQQEAWLV
jgi:hypothetical protein